MSTSRGNDVLLRGDAVPRVTSSVAGLDCAAVPRSRHDSHHTRDFEDAAAWLVQQPRPKGLLAPRCCNDLAAGRLAEVGTTLVPAGVVNDHGLAHRHRGRHLTWPEQRPRRSDDTQIRLITAARSAFTSRTTSSRSRRAHSAALPPVNHEGTRPTETSGDHSPTCVQFFGRFCARAPAAPKVL